MKLKTTVLIDGFNVFHSMDGNASLKKYKWLNLHSLSEQLIDKSKEEIQTIYYFSAIYTKDSVKKQKHEIYIKALRSVGVEIVLGKFKYKSKKCRQCGSIIPIAEEKTTDVNIATHLLEIGFKNNSDKVLIISGDTDLMPAINTFKILFPTKLLNVAFPIQRVNNEIKSKITPVNCRHIKEKHLQRAQLPEVITYKGHKVFKPLSWTTKAKANTT